MKVQRKTFSEVIDHAIDYIDIGGGMCIYKNEVLRNGKFLKKYEGFSSKRTLKTTVFSGLAQKINGKSLMYASNDFFNNKFNRIDQFIPKPYQPYTDFSMGKITTKNIFWRNSSNGIYFYFENKEPLPQPIFFDYIHGMSNTRYNLEKLNQYLNTRNDIKFQYTFGDNNHIQKVPSYNADFYNHHYIGFYWVPDNNIYSEIIKNTYEKTSKYYGRIPQYIFDNDCLGVRGAGCALFDDYYSEIEYKRDTEYD